MIEDYFDYEASIEGLAEFYNGEVFDMAGGSENHSSISQNVSGEIRSRLGTGPCRVHGSDFRLRIDSTNDFVRPEVWVICGKTERYKDRNDTAKNPTLVIEVQSESTTNFDRSGKFQRYRSIPTLMEYVLVEQTHPQVDLFFRKSDDIWEFRSITDLRAEVVFQSLGVAVPMADIYRNVEFEAVEVKV